MSRGVAIRLGDEYSFAVRRRYLAVAGEEEAHLLESAMRAAMPCRYGLFLVAVGAPIAIFWLVLLALQFANGPARLVGAAANLGLLLASWAWAMGWATKRLAARLVKEELRLLRNGG